jgi:hypothetical protein
VLAGGGLALDPPLDPEPETVTVKVVCGPASE